MSLLSEQITPIKRGKLQDSVYRKLCELILGGGIAPGQSVTVGSLADAFGVSPTPIREALMRLSAAGALTVVSGRTVGIPPLSRDRLDDLRRVRTEIESVAMRWACERTHPVFVKKLGLILERLRGTESTANAKLYVHANYDFHFCIYRHANSALLLTIIENLWLQISPFFHLLRESGNFRISNQHHVDILRAIEAGSQNDAVEALLLDIGDAYDILSKLI